MRTFAQKPKNFQESAFAKSTIRGHAPLLLNREVNSILYLQRTIGNHAIQQTLQRDVKDVSAGLSGAASPRFGHDFSRIPIHPPVAGVIQRKLEINKPGDEYEQEADRIADQAMRMTEPTAVASSPIAIQRQCAVCDDDEKVSRVRQMKAVMQQALSGKADNDELFAQPVILRKEQFSTPHETPSSPLPIADRLAARQAGGEPLPAEIRQRMEHAVGHDFSHVRIHRDAEANEMSRHLSALAFTHGSHIYFAHGSYDPHGASGKRLLAHELTHVVQQQNHSHQRPTIQRDLALEPPHPAAAGRVLTAEEMREAIDFNNGVIGAGGPDLIREVRDVIGTSPEPAVVDEDFVNAVVTWQAMQGLVQDGKLGPRTAAPLFREIGAEGVGECRVQNGATYTPAAPAVVPAGGGAETAHFALSADFENDPANGIFPSCCEVRQFIRWNAASAAAFGATGVPHGGFPAGTPANTFIEDRDDANHRYGHRSGPSSDPQLFDQYLDATGNRNQAFGHLYRGTDDPTPIAAHAVGQWQFYLRVNDVCNGGRRVGGDSLIRINW